MMVTKRFQTALSAGILVCVTAGSHAGLTWAQAGAQAGGQGAAPATAAAVPTLRIKAPGVGEKAADFSLMTLDGKKVELAELLKTGPVVLIELRGWVGYQCPVCSTQVHDFVAKSKEILASGAKVVLVYPGPADKLKAHAEEFVAGKGLPEGFLFVTDPGMAFVTGAGLRWVAPNETAYPATFVIDKTGVVRYSNVSKTHGGRPPAADVVKALGELPK